MSYVFESNRSIIGKVCLFLRHTATTTTTTTTAILRLSGLSPGQPR